MNIHITCIYVSLVSLNISFVKMIDKEVLMQTQTASIFEYVLQNIKMCITRLSCTTEDWQENGFDDKFS